MLSTRKIYVSGIVQGVGFRPFIFQLAKKYMVYGYVTNTSHGVEIEIEGKKKKLEDFIRDIEKEKPLLAYIDTVTWEETTQKNYTSFVIDQSKASKTRSTLISPDMAICKDCLRELFKEDDRRYQYPFINCTNCGPRYTIIQDIPYDRPFTAMSKFTMCPKCQSEYDKPTDRRFHAQPNACWDCGPQVALYTNKQEAILCDNPIEKTRILLKKGKILAIKGLGGYHLAVNATDENAVKELRKRKRRQEKPFALMSCSENEIRSYAEVTPDALTLLRSPSSPIVLLDKKSESLIAPSVAYESETYGVMLPYTPLHAAILREGFTALVMTSGNISEEAIVIDNDKAFEKLGNIADYFLIHNRDIYLRTDDSIQKFIDDKPVILRRSRGYAPRPIFLKDELSPVLACGADLKNTVCLTKSSHALMSQHIGDLENISTFDFFEMSIEHMKKIFQLDPKVIAYDLHPNYYSSKYALAQKGMQHIGIQHHFAHIASCMAENKIDGEVIGIALDGTGYGTDGNIWGGEILQVSPLSFKRLAHFAYIPMPGGEKCARESWRMAYSYLYQAFGKKVSELDIPFMQKYKPKLGILKQMIEKNINAPLTSSCGRLFDGISALIGVKDISTYEGQAAILLEMAAKNGKNEELYTIDIEDDTVPFRISFRNLIKEIVCDIASGKDQAVISYRFHNSVAQALTFCCREIRKENKLSRVALSGGVFQNKLLTELLKRKLEKEGFSVFTHSLVPPNDGGISLGQAFIAGNRIKNK